MATTTVKLWSENPGDVTAEGLEIGGVKVTYAELIEITDVATALDRGLTYDLLDLWANQGGRDYSQLVDWLYQYAEECEIQELSDRLPETVTFEDEPPHAFAKIKS